MRHDWTAQEIAEIYRTPLLSLLLRAQQVTREFHSPRSGADVPSRVDQDRRLPGGLRVLPAERALRHAGGAAGR